MNPRLQAPFPEFIKTGFLFENYSSGGQKGSKAVAPIVAVAMRVNHVLVRKHFARVAWSAPSHAVAEVRPAAFALRHLLCPSVIDQSLRQRVDEMRMQATQDDETTAGI